MSDEELKTGYIKVNLDYAPRDSDKAFREWCKKHDFDCFGLNYGREAWCSRLGTYFRGASGVAYADGEPFLFYEEDLVDVDKLIDQALTAYKKELLSKAETFNNVVGTDEYGNIAVVQPFEAIPLSAIQEDELRKSFYENHAKIVQEDEVEK